jgi:ABC-type sugar transport system substrate-binding protein
MTRSEKNMQLTSVPRRRRLPGKASLAGLVAAGLAVAGVAACSSGSSSASGGAAAGGTTAPKNIVIGSMIFNTSVPFYANMIKGEKDAAAKMGAQIKIVSGNGDMSTEVSDIQQFVTERVSAILVTSSSPTGIVPAITLANQAGIPVFAVNNAVGAGAKIVTYVGSSDYTYGQQQARLLVKAVGTHGNVGYVLGQLGTSAELDRKAGFMSVLKNYPGIHIVTSQTANWDNSQALSVVQDWLSKYPKGSLNAIVDQGPEGETPARYAATNGRSEIKFIVGDYPSSVRTEIMQNQIYGTIDQNPYPQGYLGVQYAVWDLDGKASSIPKPDAYQPLPLVTAANAGSTAAAWQG